MTEHFTGFVKITHPNGYMLVDYERLMQGLSRNGRSRPKSSHEFSHANAKAIMKLANQNGGWEMEKLEMITFA